MKFKFGRNDESDGTLIKLTIDGQEVQVPAGTTVLKAAEAVGIHIPRLCYDPGLSSVGACRLCVVEIDGIRNLPASCVTWVARRAWWCAPTPRR